MTSMLLFHSYMTLKNAKLHEQFEANSLMGEKKSDIFLGVAIYVNGHTQVIIKVVIR